MSANLRQVAALGSVITVDAHIIIGEIARPDGSGTRAGSQIRFEHDLGLFEAFERLFLAELDGKTITAHRNSHDVDRNILLLEMRSAASEGTSDTPPVRIVTKDRLLHRLLRP